MSEPTLITTATLPTPVGDVILYGRGDALCGLVFCDRGDRLEAHLRRRFGDVVYRPAGDPAGALGRVRDYLDGNLRALDDIAVDLGGTPFQARVWAELRRIPLGATCSYGDIARAVGSAAAVRAVGAANGANPVSIVVPCHRVIAADGTLNGYGGGLPRKQWLLQHEGALLV
jgi:methylated-DNA-[protein]-cysteine S-methyltransferase